MSRRLRGLASVASCATSLILGAPRISSAVCGTGTCVFSGTTCTISLSFNVDDGCTLPLDGYDVLVTKPAILDTANDGDS